MKLSPLFDENGAFHKVAVIIVLGVMAALLTSVVAVATTADHEGVMLSRKPDSLPVPERDDRFGRELSKGKFLVAGRGLGDPRFRETVVLLISYDSDGAMGLIINRPTTLSLSEAFPDNGKFRNRKDTVYVGGPVGVNRMMLLIRSRTRPEQSSHVINGVYASWSREVLDRLVDSGRKGKQFHVYIGYAGWAPGQLEQEVSRGDWHITDADAKTIFDRNAAEIWPDLIRRSAVLHVRTMLRTANPAPPMAPADTSAALTLGQESTREDLSSVIP